MFKQNLLRMRQPLPASTFTEALFGNVSWAEQKAIKPAAVSVPNKSEFSEKAQVLESLERFAQETFATEEVTAIKIPGGEIAIRPEPGWDGVPSFHSQSDLMSSLTLEKPILDLVLVNKNPQSVRIMFVSESFRGFEEFKTELKEGFLNQLLPAFPARTAELFARMLGAMKLEDQEVLIYPTLYQEQDISAEVMKVAGFFRPEIIVTLGANATHKILKGQERLAQVHGQFFNRKIENIGTFIVVPLFHPSIIENNQNMKKTAWTDMQKIMKHLKKL